MLIYLCPTDRKYACSWEGSSDDILEHFMQEHEDLLSDSNSIVIELDVTSENRLLFFDDEIYLLQTKINEETLSIYLRYLGPQKIALKISYDIDIQSNATSLDRSLISISSDGCFSISLQSINKVFGNVESINCILLISGDFKSNSSDDGVFFECDTSSTDKDEFVFPKQPHTHTRTVVRNKSFEEKRKKFMNLSALFNEPSPTDTPKLARSQTISADEIRRRTVKRNPSTVSLESIQENDTEFNCTNCDEILVPPVYLCSMHHNFCAQCINNQCKVCGEQVTNERNIEVEEKCARRLYSCRNKKHGCGKKFTYKDLREHEINCKFCDYKCPMSECSFTDQFRNMHKHLRLIHSSVKIFETPILVFQKNNETFLVNEDKGIFYCNFKILADCVVWEAKFCGPKERRFFCELKFKEKNLKEPLLLRKIEDTYSISIPIPELKRLKVKSKNAILTVTC